MPRTFKFRPLEPLERENDQLRMVVIQLRRKLTTKEGYAAKLELVLHQRLETIDTLNGKLQQARAAYARLDEECEHLAQLVRLG